MKDIDNVIPNERGALLLALVGVLGFSGTLPATRLASPHLGAVQVGLGRALVAASCGVLLLLVRRSPRPRGLQWAQLAAVALGVVVGFPLLSAWALTYTTAGRGAVIVGLTPLMTAVFGALRDGSLPGRQFWLASIVGTATVVAYLATTPSESAAAAAHHTYGVLPEVALLLAAALAAVGYTEGARLTRQLGGLQVISWALIVALPVVIPTVVAYGAPPADAPWSAWLGFGYVSLVSMFLAFYFWYSGLSRAGVARASQLQLLQPLMTVTWAGLWLGENTSGSLYLTAVLVLGSVVLALRAPRSAGAIHSKVRKGI